MSFDEKCSWGSSPKRARLSDDAAGSEHPRDNQEPAAISEVYSCANAERSVRPLWLEVPERSQQRFELIKVDLASTLDPNAPCFCCGEAAVKKKPRRYYDATWDWMSHAAFFEMGDDSCANPFACYTDLFLSTPPAEGNCDTPFSLLATRQGETTDSSCKRKYLRVLMCTHCYDMWRTIGRTFTCAEATLRRIHFQLRPLLSRWNRRVGSNKEEVECKNAACAVCESIEIACGSSDTEVCRNAMKAREKSTALHESASKARNPVSASFVAVVISLGRHAVTDFCSFLSTETGVPVQDVERFLERCTVLKVCARHRNFVVRAIDYARISAGASNVMKCIFKTVEFSEAEGGGYLCTNSSSTLREIPSFIGTDASKALSLEESVIDFTSGRLTLSDVAGQLGCASCRWIVTKGATGDCDSEGRSLNDISNSVLRDCIGIIRIILDHNEKNREERLRLYASPASRYEAASNCVRMCAVDTRGFRMLPTRAAEGLYHMLRSVCATPREVPALSSRSIQRHLQVFLAPKGIHLHTLSSRLRVYASNDSITSNLAAIYDEAVKPANKFTQIPAGLNADEISQMLSVLGKRYETNKKNYIDGNFVERMETVAIPQKLFTHISLGMMSSHMRAMLVYHANRTERPLHTMWPASNRDDVVPSGGAQAGLQKRNTLYSPHIQDKDNDSPSTVSSFADSLHALRVVTVIENMVFAQGGASSECHRGPIGMQNTLAASMETSASYQSVLNRLGYVLSYDFAQAEKNKLASRRESDPRGCFSSWSFEGERGIPVLSVDNVDISTKNPVYHEGRKSTMLNGTASGVYRRGRGPKAAALMESDRELPRNGWRTIPRLPGSLFADREAFVNSMNSSRHNALKDSFATLAFGLIFTQREDLLKKGGERGLQLREMLKLAFKSHGGKSRHSLQVKDQEVVMFRVSGEPASHKSTIREELLEFWKTYRPGTGKDLLVILEGDEPLYTMYMELYAESEKQLKEDQERGTLSAEDEYFCNWAVAFPGLFHAEKGPMFSILKSLLQGFGLKQFSSIVFPPGKAKGFFNNPDNRDNRNVIFNSGGAILLQCADMMLESCPLVRDEVQALLDSYRVNGDTYGNALTDFALSEHVDTSVVTNKILHVGRCLLRACDSYFSDCPNGQYFYKLFLRSVFLNVLAFHVTSRCGHTDIHEYFWEQLVGVVHASSHIKYQRLILSHAVMKERMPRSAFFQLYTETPGLSVITASSFTSRSNGDREQDGSRSSTARAVRTPVQEGSWAGRGFVHIDEHHEMIIIRPIKASGIQDIVSLQRCPAWIMQLSEARARMRLITGATRNYGRHRGAEDGGEDHEEVFMSPCDKSGPDARDARQGDDEMLDIDESEGGCTAIAAAAESTNTFPDKAVSLPSKEPALLSFLQKAVAEGYNREHVQVRSFVAIFEKLQSSQFLSPDHMHCEFITSVLDEPSVAVDNMDAQKSILNVVKHGNQYAALHLSVIFPEIFGPLTQSDKDKWFNGKKFSAWSTFGQVQFLYKCLPTGVLEISAAENRRTANNASEKIMRDRKALVAKRVRDLDAAVKNAFKTLSQELTSTPTREDCISDEATRADAASVAAKRQERIMHIQQYIALVSDVLDSVQANRHLLASADAYRDLPTYEDSSARSSCKSGFMEELEILSGLSTSSTVLSNYSPDVVFVDVMNCLHYKGTGGLGPSLKQFVTAKLHTVLSRHLAGSHNASVQELHLAVDISRLVVRHKASKQNQRDASRVAEPHSAPGTVQKWYHLDDSVEDVAWASLITRGHRKYQLATYHLFNGALVAVKIGCANADRKWNTFLWGGAFILSTRVVKESTRIQDTKAFLVPESEYVLICCEDEDEMIVLAKHVDKEGSFGSDSGQRETSVENVRSATHTESHYAVPIGHPLQVDESGIISVHSEYAAYHGEAETLLVRILCTHSQRMNAAASTEQERNCFSELNPVEGPDTAIQSMSHTKTVVDSGDVDVLAILLSCWEILPEYIRSGILFKMKQKCVLVADVVATAASEPHPISPMLLAIAYCAAGGDFTPGTVGVHHKFYLQAAWFHSNVIGTIDMPGRSLEGPIAEVKLDYLKSQVDLLTIIAYLRKMGITQFLTEFAAEHRRQELIARVARPKAEDVYSKEDFEKEVKSWFVCTQDIGADLWRTEARCIINDRAKSSATAIPAREFIAIQACRVNAIVGGMWSRSGDKFCVHRTLVEQERNLDTIRMHLL